MVSNFKPIDLPTFDLVNELNLLIKNKKIHWPKENQICINTLPTHPDNYEIGSGSLRLDWGNKKIVKKSDGTEEIFIPERIIPREESDFNQLCSVFKNTLFEKVYSQLKTKYSLGRVRLMKMKPKTCLSWHQDMCPRVHYPIVTEKGCLMIIENEVRHMPVNTWWYTNTLPYHTAINSSNIERIHLVASILI